MSSVEKLRDSTRFDGNFNIFPLIVRQKKKSVVRTCPNLINNLLKKVNVKFRFNYFSHYISTTDCNVFD